MYRITFKEKSINTKNFSISAKGYADNGSKSGDTSLFTIRLEKSIVGFRRPNNFDIHRTAQMTTRILVKNISEDNSTNSSFLNINL